ncbi:hypothetical protein PtA15_3A423 [Puccinia triticina]|uniref:Uncharacterized protein n=1 Tax=Puccinia triticina TaxID=208348 RepID=A0ABY7CCV3_9BASI|nr:uncharacterized protein PtA15_3A423 [Puccinia triticina]WAQ83056.1 hypothetical protein PtA15_3A423 [Puccinia triticina]
MYHSTSTLVSHGYSPNNECQLSIPNSTAARPTLSSSSPARQKSSSEDIINPKLAACTGRNLTNSTNSTFNIQDLSFNPLMTQEDSNLNLDNPILTPIGHDGEADQAVNRTEDAEDAEVHLDTLSGELMEEIAEMELDALREKEALHTKVKRLPAYLKVEVANLYYEFQRSSTYLQSRIRYTPRSFICTSVKLFGRKEPPIITSFVG